MKKETKDEIALVSSLVLTAGTSVLLGSIAGWGATALISKVFPDGITRGQLKMFGAIVGVGSAGVALYTAETVYPVFHGYFQDVVDTLEHGHDKEAPNNG
jgi:hypothetical protein